MPDALEPGRYGMQQEPANELLRRDRHAAGFIVMSGAVLLVLKGDLAIGDTEQTLIADRDSVRVAAKIFENLLRTAEWRLGVDHPFHAAERCEQRPEPGRVPEPFDGTGKLEQIVLKGRLKRFQKKPPEKPGQNADTEEEPRPAGDPLGAIRTQSAAGNNAMDVRVKQKILAPRVKDGEEANARAEMFGIGGDCL